MKEHNQLYEASQARQGNRDKPSTIRKGTQDRQRQEKTQPKRVFRIIPPFFPQPKTPKKEGE